jgi:inorganic triphosphatase YgiF
MSDGLTEHAETELKMEAGSGFTVPDLSALAAGLTVTEPEVRLLEARYFDSADQRLAAAGIILRRRTGGTDAGWHLKLPVSAGTRRELQAPLGEADTVPAQLASKVSGLVRDQPLQVVATLQTRRTVRYLRDEDGSTLAEVADDLVTGRIPGPGNTPGEPVSWREIEVELVDGGPEILDAARSRLAAAGARPSSSSSKLSRLLGSPAAAARQGA